MDREVCGPLHCMLRMGVGVYVRLTFQTYLYARSTSRSYIYTARSSHRGNPTRSARESIDFCESFFLKDPIEKMFVTAYVLTNLGCQRVKPRPSSLVGLLTPHRRNCGGWHICYQHARLPSPQNREAAPLPACSCSLPAVQHACSLSPESGRRSGAPVASSLAVTRK